MKSFFQFFCVSLCLGLISSCSQSDHQISVTFAGNTAAFANASAVDLVLVVTNLELNGEILDVDSNGDPDTFVFPESCGALISAGCGYEIQSGQIFSIGAFPLNFKYELEARIRDASGNNIASGQTTFTNTSDLTTLIVNL
ncbi:MAG: hypothetical protein KDD48_05920 [Bdellovibrionales bacterium]|nr:hypothetical protein [Bdellovibrionales bacterium]